MSLNLLNDADKARLYEKLRRPDMWDACHKYGWVITLVGTLIFQVVFWSYSVGMFKQTVADFGARIDRLERQIDSLNHITRQDYDKGEFK